MGGFSLSIIEKYILITSRNTISNFPILWRVRVPKGMDSTPILIYNNNYYINSKDTLICLSDTFCQNKSWLKLHKSGILSKTAIFGYTVEVLQK